MRRRKFTADGLKIRREGFRSMRPAGQLAHNPNNGLRKAAPLRHPARLELERTD